MPRRARLLLLAVPVVVFATIQAVGGSGAEPTAARRTSAAVIDNPIARGAAPVTTGVPRTTAAPVAPVTTAPPPTVALPRPKPASADGQARDKAPVVQIGTMEIPKIGLVHPIFEGNTLTQIDHGPSHWPGTAIPGHIGNAVFAGHRVTHSHPFRDIDRLVPGDPVYFDVDGRRTTYRVTGSKVVSPNDTWIINQTPTATATLFACHPPHSARYRYVVDLALVEG